jgi:hypothetical protein
MWTSGIALVENVQLLSGHYLGFALVKLALSLILEFT